MNSESSTETELHCLAAALRSVLQKKQELQTFALAEQSLNRLKDLDQKSFEVETRLFRVLGSSQIGEEARKIWIRLRQARVELDHLTCELDALLLDCSRTRNVTMVERSLRMARVFDPFESFISGVVNDLESQLSNGGTVDLSGKQPDAKSKKSNEKFPREAQQVLRDWFYEHFDHPYPTKAEKQHLCASSKISMHQLNQWFTNARLRLWKRSKGHSRDSVDYSTSQDGHSQGDVNSPQRSTRASPPKFTRVARESGSFQ
jgi:hypothetical protein